jgi:hypothetical protein
MISHQLIVHILLELAKDVAVQRISLLVYWRLAPAAGLVAKLGARRDGSAQARNLHSPMDALDHNASSLHNDGGMKSVHAPKCLVRAE